jgi:hypothetical protein
LSAGTLALGDLFASEAILLSGGGIGARLIEAGSLGLTAGGAADLETVRVAGAATIAATDIDVDVLDAGSADLDAGRDLTLGTATVAGELTAAAGGAIRVDRATIEGRSSITGQAFSAGVLETGGLDLASAGYAAVTQLRSSGTANIEAGGSVSLGDGEVMGATFVRASGAIRVGRLETHGSQSLSARDDVVFDSLRAVGVFQDRGDIRLMSGEGELRGGTVLADGDLVMSARGDVRHTGLAAGGNLVIDAERILGGGSSISAGARAHLHVRAQETVHLAQVSAVDLDIMTPGSIRIASASVGNRASFAAGAIDVANLTKSGSGPLGLSISGPGLGAARSVVMNIDAPGGILVDMMRILDGRFSTTARMVSILNGEIAGEMRWTTPVQTVLVDNRSMMPRGGVDLQLQTRTSPFTMTLDGNRAVTNAIAITAKQHVRFTTPAGQLSLVDALGALLRPAPATIDVRFGDLFSTPIFVPQVPNVVRGNAFEPAVNLEPEDDDASSPSENHAQAAQL